MASTHERTTTDTPTRYADALTRRVTADNGIEYAYRDLGDGDVPLILLQHFRGNLDNGDPALVDALTAGRRVVAFDNVGVGAKLAPNDAPPPAPGDQTPPPGG
jgi:pimeloyl-ACP methyl ester carboxylesterase